MSDNYTVVVKPDQTVYIYTGATTQLQNVGGGAEVYKGLLGTTSQLRTLVQGANMIITEVGDTIVFDAGISGGTFMMIGSGSTSVSKISGNTWVVYTPSGATGNYASQPDFVSHTGDTSIHFKQSGITISQSQVTGLVTALAGKSSTGHTHTSLPSLTINQSQVNGLVTALAGKSSTAHTHTYAQITSKPNFVGSGTTTVSLVGSDYRIYSPVAVAADWQTLTNRPSWLTGTTLNLFQNAHTHSQYLTGVTWNIITGKPSFNYLPLSGGTLIGHVDGTSLQLSGDLTVNGTMHVIKSDVVYSKANYYFTRSGNTQGLGVGEISGIGVLNADSSGTTVVLGADKNGIMRVGWSGDTLVALAGREDTPTNGYYAKWNSTLHRFDTVDLDTTIGQKLNTSIYQTYTGTTAPQAFASKSFLSTYTGTTAPATFANKSAFNSFTGTTATLYSDNKLYRGFINNTNINVAYDWSTRKVTLSGTLEYYWNGIKKSFTSPKTFTSGHTATVGKWYLYSSDGTNFNWSQVPWTFDDIQVAQVYYQSTSGATFAVREVHGTMDSESHETFHNTVGTYISSGGQPFAYTANTATNTANSPSFASAIINDEDLDTIIPQLNKGSYTLMTVTGATKSKYYQNAALPFSGATNVLMFVNNTTTGAFAAGQSSRWYNVYQILLPVTSDAPSQKYRMVFLQPQVAYTSLAAAQAESVNGLYLGDLTSASNEYVIYTRITYATAASSNYGKCSIASITYNVGNHLNNVTVVGGASATNHQNLSNLDWANSAHIASTVSSLASFNSSGIAEELPKATFALSATTTNFNTYTGTTAPAAFMPKLATIAVKTGTTYTALAADNAKILEFTATGATTITLPTGLTTGYQITIVNYSSSVKTIAAGSGATVRSKSSNLKLSTIYNAATAYYRGSNVWVVFGDLTSS